MKAQRPLVQYLGSPTDEARISRMWTAIRSAPEPRSRAWVLAAAPLAAAAAVLVWMVWPSEPMHAPTIESTQPVQTAAFAPPSTFTATDGARSFELADGSRIELDANARLTTIESGDERFVTLLERGRATFEVRPGGPRRWVIESGLATIEVVGTAFVVERGEARVDVRVRRGVVLVRGERVPDRVVRLGAGESLTVRASPVIDVSAEAATESATASESATETATESATATESPAAEDVGEPMQRASAARREGERGPAAILLPRASTDEDDTRAALEQFTLGRVEMDELDRPARARRALRRAVHLGLPQRLEQQAQRRLQQLGR